MATFIVETYEGTFTVSAACASDALDKADDSHFDRTGFVLPSETAAYVYRQRTRGRAPVMVGCYERDCGWWHRVAAL